MKTRVQRAALVVGATSALAFVVFCSLVFADGLAEKVYSPWRPFVLGSLILVVASFVAWTAETIRTS